MLICPLHIFFSKVALHIHLLIGFFVGFFLLLLIFESSFCIPDTSPLVCNQYTWFATIFPQSVVCLFMFLIGS